MTLTFYGAPFSTSSSTSAVLDELEHGLPTPLAERINLSIEKGETKSPDYLTTVNPNGLVPALVHDGVSIWESAAVNMYLGETFGVRGGPADPKPSLYPAPGPKRGEAMKWIVWCNTTLATAGYLITAAAAPCADKDGAAADGTSSAAAVKAKEATARAFGIINGALKGRSFLLGEEYCLADTHLWTFMNWIKMLGVTWDDYPDLKEWVARVGARPALACKKM